MSKKHTIPMTPNNRAIVELTDQIRHQATLARAYVLTDVYDASTIPNIKVIKDKMDAVVEQLKGLDPQQSHLDRNERIATAKDPITEFDLDGNMTITDK